MALSTYADLLASIKAWTRRTDFSDALCADFVTLCEDRINTRLRIRAMESTLLLTTVAGTATVALPTRYKAMKSIYLDEDRDNPLTWMPAEQLRLEYPGDETSKPLAYTTEGENLVLGPTPDSDYTIRGMFYQGFSPLSSSTNSLWTNHPSIYLFGSLAEAWDYQIEDAKADRYLKRFEIAAGDIEREDAMDRISGSVLQIRTDVAHY